jgi:hypothetical protein
MKMAVYFPLFLGFNRTTMANTGEEDEEEGEVAAVGQS